MTEIDRRALVVRHSPRNRRIEPLEPLTVGNGEFAYTVDVTGLQSLPDRYVEGIGLHTFAQWGWHTAPNPNGYTLGDSLAAYPVGDGRTVRYPTTGTAGAVGRHELAATWLRENPHRADLGRIGLLLDGRPIDPDRLSGIDQRLDLWSGRIDSSWAVDGTPVRVVTACHPELDLVAIRVESELLTDGRLTVGFGFPYAVGDWSDTSDWASVDRHHSTAVIGAERAHIHRVMDSDTYSVLVNWPRGGRLVTDGDRHEYLLHGSGAPVLDLTVRFRPGTDQNRDAVRDPAGSPTVDATLGAAARHWEAFWREGAAVDLAQSTDPRAVELERRTVLSQYLTAVNCSGTTPPAETGLVAISWRGKFHLEMHWWHAAHFPLWNRAGLLARSLAWYQRILPSARAYAAAQGYPGARWPKQVGPEARESPSDVGAFLIWQQPHPIFYAELLYRNAAGSGTGESARHAVVDEYAELVQATAEFLAAYPIWNETDRRFDLGPPLASAQEKAFRDRKRSKNPTFELAYWAWALRLAGDWRQRNGLPRDERWDRVADQLAEPPRRDGRYIELEQPLTGPEGHPTMVGALGFVPALSGTPGRGAVVDPDVMRATLRYVLEQWELDDTWGWDYPLLAMTACRLNEPGLAVDALMMDSPKNRYLGNGHNFQHLPRLPLYLPGNGGLLYAVAMMAGGWDGAPERPAPGFPSDEWAVRAEGFHRAP